MNSEEYKCTFKITLNSEKDFLFLKNFVKNADLAFPIPIEELTLVQTVKKLNFTHYYYYYLYIVLRIIKGKILTVLNC